jgi:pilus assembly protein CpaE
MKLNPVARIQLVSNDLVVRSLLQATLIEKEYEVSVSDNAEDALTQIKAHAPDLVITDTVLPGMDGFILCKKLRKEPVTHFLPVLMLADKGDVGDKITGIEAGADDYVVKPFDVQELIWCIKKLLTRHTPTDVPALAHSDQHGMIIAVFSPKGGVGNTTVAVNAAVDLQRSTKKPVVIMDADFAFGLVGVSLNLSSSHNILNLIDTTNSLDEDFVRQVLIKHESGLHVLLCPLNPEEAEGITAAQVGAVLDKLVSIFSYVVVDCHSNYDERTLEVLEKAYTVLLVIIPEIGPLMVTSRFLDLAGRLGLPTGKIDLVLNRSNSNVGYEVKEIERALKMKVKFNIISGGREVVISANKGTPMVMQNPTHAFSKGIQQITESIIALDANRTRKEE